MLPSVVSDDDINFQHDLLMTKYFIFYFKYAKTICSEMCICMNCQFLFCMFVVASFCALKILKFTL